MGELLGTVVRTLPTTVAETKGAGVEEDEDPDPEGTPPGVDGEPSLNGGDVLLLEGASCAPRLPVTTTLRE